MEKIVITNPATLEYYSGGGVIRLYDANGFVNYYRKLKEAGLYRFNVPLPGQYFADNFEVRQVLKLIKKDFNITLPPPERNDRVKDTALYMGLKNLDISSPARTFTFTGEIQTSKKFNTYPPPVKLFILLHEKGHLLYKNEEYCDLYALKEFLNLGYNQSTALFCLTKILNRTVTQNVHRITSLFNETKIIL